MGQNGMGAKMRMGRTGVVDEGWALGTGRNEEGTGVGGWGGVGTEMWGSGNGRWAETGVLRETGAQGMGAGNMNGDWNEKARISKGVDKRDRDRAEDRCGRQVRGKGGKEGLGWGVGTGRWRCRHLPPDSIRV